MRCRKPYYYAALAPLKGKNTTTITLWLHASSDNSTIVGSSVRCFGVTKTSRRCTEKPDCENGGRLRKYSGFFLTFSISYYLELFFIFFTSYQEIRDVCTMATLAFLLLCKGDWRLGVSLDKFIRGSGCFQVYPLLNHFYQCRYCEFLSTTNNNKINNLTYIVNRFLWCSQITRVLAFILTMHALKKSCSANPIKQHNIHLSRRNWSPSQPAAVVWVVTQRVSPLKRQRCVTSPNNCCEGRYEDSGRPLQRTLAFISKVSKEFKVTIDLTHGELSLLLEQLRFCQQALQRVIAKIGCRN